MFNNPEERVALAEKYFEQLADSFSLKNCKGRSNKLLAIFFILFYKNRYNGITDRVKDVS